MRRSRYAVAPDGAGLRPQKRPLYGGRKASRRVGVAAASRSYGGRSLDGELMRAGGGKSPPPPLRRASLARSKSQRALRSGSGRVAGPPSLSASPSPSGKKAALPPLPLKLRLRGESLRLIEDDAMQPGTRASRRSERGGAGKGRPGSAASLSSVSTAESAGARRSGRRAAPSRRVSRSKSERKLMGSRERRPPSSRSATALEVKLRSSGGYVWPLLRAR
eukprot:PLAT8309.2.p2 GENE.PLAT8309.2~~PLAT8309.2.p2  ORF type:complete len:227 (+),score=51.61 PLAT8309.2:23-682(+)